ncbi:MAG: YHYH protein [Deltaproteobacteria bacterium]|nr:YHYH protein [Deltaproteobacteria bacterium]
MKRMFVMCLCMGFMFCTSTGEENQEEESETIDITNAVLTSLSASCEDYVGTYASSITETSDNRTLEGALIIAENDTKCTFISNSIPNHNVNGTAFATTMSAVQETFQISKTPTAAASTTALSLTVDNAIMLNGVKLDLLAAACAGVADEKIGCNDDTKPWRFDPMYTGNNFGTDDNHAHTQPDGAYHYHGDPLAMYDDTGNVISPVIGFAADGFPIYGTYIDDDGTVRKVESGYTLKDGGGARVSQVGEEIFPGGNYDGTYRDDWEWTDAGDLDACNGMMYKGNYAYFVTRSYPWILGCFTGTPDPTFHK